MKRRLGDRRGRPRFEIVGDLLGTLETVVGMPLRNICRGGALVQSSVPLTLDSVHHVAVTSAGVQEPASVRVRHVRPMVGSDGSDYYLIGFEFLSIPAPLQVQIDAWTDAGGV